MDTYITFEAGSRSTASCDVALGAPRPTDAVNWLRAYVAAEPAGSRGTVRIYEASSPDAVLRHANAAGVRIDEVVRVIETGASRPELVAA